MAAKFEKFLASPGFPINFRKSHRISKNYIISSKSYGQKPLRGPKDSPGLNRVKRSCVLQIGIARTSLNLVRARGLQEGLLVFAHITTIQK